jgi:hypothetical protein
MWTEEKGMSLRDYFASQALQGILAGDCFSSMPITMRVETAYAYADAMLEVRKKEQGAA